MESQAIFQANFQGKTQAIFLLLNTSLKMLSVDWAPMMGPPLDGLCIRPCRMSSRRLPPALHVAQHTENMPGHAAWRQLYKNRSSRTIDSRILFSREWDFGKTFSLTENQFSGKTYLYTIHPRFCEALMVRPPCSMHRNMLSHRPGHEGSRVCLDSDIILV